MMEIWKKFACHRVYDSYNHFFNQSVVSISRQREVLSITPLTSEISSTEWIGGVIILSGLEEVPPHLEIHNIFQELTSSNQPPLYAWHISDFDFHQEKIIPQSIIQRL